MTRQTSLTRESLIAGLLLLAGVTLCGLALFMMREPPRVVQATPPLQSTPGADSKPTAPTAAPAAPATRPADIAPEPARPDADAQNKGAQPALPPAPAEKLGDPVRPNN